MSHFENFDLVILFFILGAFASWIKSDLEIPEAVAKFLSIFLLLSLGLKGGHEVRIAANLEGFFPALLIGMFSCLILPSALFFGLKKKFGVANAAAIASAYGSVSAVTFVTAQGLLENEGIAFNGYMVAIMALMEIPAILTGIYFYKKFSSELHISSKSLVKSILSTKSVVLLIGGFGIGLLMNDVSWKGIAPVVQGCFKGVLAFFLLDLGVVAQRQLKEAWKLRMIAIPVAILSPIFFGSLALIACHLVGLTQGNQILMATLVGSASYIAAPAAIRSAIPLANPSLYLALPLALTFPMNLLLGIPVYIQISKWLVAV